MPIRKRRRSIVGTQPTTTDTTTTTDPTQTEGSTTTGDFGGTATTGTERDGPHANASNAAAAALVASVPWAVNDPGLLEAILAAEGVAEEKWGEVDQTTVADLRDEDGNVLSDVPEGSVLFIASSPEDMDRLEQEREAGLINEGADIVILWNPSQAAARAAAESGKFSNVIFSGHGTEGAVYMTGEDGEAEQVDGEAFANLFAGTAVENVFLNACRGAQGTESVADDLADAGINAMAWSDKVKDSEALEAAGLLVDIADQMSSGELDAAALQETADRFDGPGGRLIARLARNEEPEAEFAEDEDLFGFTEFWSFLLFF